MLVNMFRIAGCLIFAGIGTACCSAVSDDPDTLIELLNNSAIDVTLHKESEFPTDLFTEEQRKHGAIVLHIMLAVYCFVAIATVCTEYFMPTIACICQAFKLSDDVAAATFMSIATSSPELFTNIIGTFITDSDIGVGHVLGNAYYDMFFVASLGGLAASREIVLDWWPIVRDCSIYLVVAATLTWVVWDGEVQSYECVVLLSLYIIYFIIMFKNRAIIRFLKQRLGINITDPVDDAVSESSSGGSTQTGTTTTEEEKMLPNANKTYIILPKTEKTDGETMMPNVNETYIVLPQSINDENAVGLPDSQTKIKPTGFKLFLKRLGKLLVLPLRLLASYTIPDVRKPRLRKLYPISFVMCVCWIGVSTYLGTWMISTIGETIGIPDIIMGMVFMAAGGSVVEAYGVYYKARRGECSIGLSNSMGCNTLDVTMCLALPWLVKTLLPTATGRPSPIILASEVLHYNCSLLILSVLVIFGVMLINRFRLNWKLGVCSGIAYISVLAAAITLESQQQSVS